MNFEEEYEAVLQNIEFGIISVYRQDRSLLDYDVMDALEALIRHYAAEQSGRTPPTPRLHERAQRVFEAARSMCELRLGRQNLETDESASETAGEENRDVSRFGKSLKGRFGLARTGQRKQDQGGMGIEPIPLEEIIKCLKRIQTSVRRWNKQGGRQGYLNFVSEFIR